MCIFTYMHIRLYTHIFLNKQARIAYPTQAWLNCKSRVSPTSSRPYILCLKGRKDER